MRRAPRFRLAWGLVCWGCLSCGPSARTGLEPEVSLAGSAEAQAQFRALREQWVRTPPDARPQLERELTRFIQRFPEDPQGRWVRIYLAWIRLQRGDLELAERWLGLADPGPSGAAFDLSEVVRASIDLAAGRAPLAYAKLSALEGRLIDPDDRLLCLERLVSASLAVHLYPDALQQMLELAALAARRHRERLWRTLEPRLAQVPLPVLEESLPRLSAAAVESPSVRPAERAAAVDWMRQQILEILSKSALEHQDAELAQRLVATNPAAAKSGTADRSELLWLATQGGLTPSIVQRTLGLVLEVGDPSSRQRSMDVASGIALTLDLARRALGTDQLALETRPLDGARMADSLARLAGDGAALLVAGFDARGARLAADFAAESSIPVLLLHPPEGAARGLPPSAFVVGADPAAAHPALRAALEPRVDGLLALGSTEAPCADLPPAPPSGGGEARRPGVLVLGGAECGPSLLELLEAAPGRFSVGLGLDAHGLLSEPLPVRELWAVTAGRLPDLELGPDVESGRWFTKKGRAPTWYEALGHDVARLAAAVIPAAPPAPLRDPARVAEVHRQVTARLADGSFDDLWTSEEGKFVDRRLRRQFRVVPRGAPSPRREP